LVDTLRWLCEAYCGSTEFAELGKSTGHVRRLILEGICLSKNRKEKERGGLPFALMQERHIREIRDEKAEFPEAANSRLKALRQLFVWAKAARHVTINPALEVKRLRSASEGFHTWTDEEIARFEAAHPIGTKPRLAFALLRYTGVRRSDVVKLGKGMERDGALHFTVTKGALRKGRAGGSGPKRLSLPILPGLRAILEATPSGHMTYLVTEHGKPFTAPGFGNKFRDWCNQAGLHHCSAHGIRKFDATAAAENGATAHQLMAMFGWDSIKQAEHYTRKASQQKLATGAMHLLTRDDEERIGDQSVPLPVGMLRSGTQRQN
jgi:integrase